MRFWQQKSPVNVARAYVKAANASQFDALEALLHDDARIVDAAGAEVAGKAACLALMRQVHAIAPVLQMQIDSYVERSDSVLMAGRIVADDERLARPTQFRAYIEDGKVREWQSFSAQPVLPLSSIAASVAA